MPGPEHAAGGQHERIGASSLPSAHQQAPHCKATPKHCAHGPRRSRAVGDRRKAPQKLRGRHHLPGCCPFRGCRRMGGWSSKVARAARPHRRGRTRPATASTPDWIQGAPSRAASQIYPPRAAFTSRTRQPACRGRAATCPLVTTCPRLAATAKKHRPGLPYKYHPAPSPFQSTAIQPSLPESPTLHTLTRAGISCENEVVCSWHCGDGVLRGHRAGRQLLPGRRDLLGPGPRQDRGRRARARPHARQELRLRVPVQERVPLRQDRHADQARPGQLRRHGHHLLPVVAGEHARRDRLRVPGQRDRRAVHAAHQRVHSGAGAAGAAVPPLVRPNHGLPHLFHRLEPAARHFRGGRQPDQGLQEPRGARRGVPQEPADAAVREPVERGRLGHAGRAREGGLDPGAVRRLVPRLQRRRVRVGERQAAVPRRHHGDRGGGGQARPRRQQLVEPAAQRHELPPDAVGAEEVHDLQLLHGRQALPTGRARRVQAPVRSTDRPCMVRRRRPNPAVLKPEIDAREGGE